MKNRISFLSIHNRIIDRGCMTKGLCRERLGNSILDQNEIFELFIPTSSEKRHHKTGWFWWGHDYMDGYGFDFYGPTRQNIILLCAAINGEL